MLVWTAFLIHYSQPTPRQYDDKELAVLKANCATEQPTPRQYDGQELVVLKANYATEQPTPRQFDDQELVVLTVNNIMEKSGQQYSWAFGTALKAIRDQRVSYDDIDFMVFQFLMNEEDMISIDKSFIENGFQAMSSLGTFAHGLERRYQKHLPIPSKVDIFFMYSELHDNGTEFWWCASYFGRCDKMKYGKCRYKFTPFALQNIDVHGIPATVPATSYLIEHYGENWTVPLNYSYGEGLNKYWTNIIEE